MTLQETRSKLWALMSHYCLQHPTLDENAGTFALLAVADALYEIRSLYQNSARPVKPNPKKKKK